MTKRFILRHIFRSKLKALLTLAVAALFSVALSWLSLAIAHNVHETDRLYNTTVVSFDIIQRDASAIRHGREGTIFGVIAPLAIDRILDTGFIMSHELETRIQKHVIAAMLEPHEIYGPQYIPHDMNRRTPDVLVTAFNHTARVTPDTGGLRRQRYIVTYAEGWDESFFTEDWTLERLLAQDYPPLNIPEEILAAREEFIMRTWHGLHTWTGIHELFVPIVVDRRLMDEHGFVYGEIMSLTFNQGLRDASHIICVIVGSYTTPPDIFIGHHGYILMPISALRSMREPLGLRWDGYQSARFEINPAFNREMDEIISLVDGILSDRRAGLVGLQAIFWDSELRMAITPMERNLQLMQVLYPVTLTVSVLISAGLALLMSLLKANVSAMLRVLGASRLRVRFILFTENFAVSFVGLCLGLLIFTAIRGNVSTLPDLPPFGHIGMYLLGAAVGALCGSVLVSNRPPLELLQVKE